MWIQFLRSLFGLVFQVDIIFVFVFFIRGTLFALGMLKPKVRMNESLCAKENSSGAQWHNARLFVSGKHCKIILGKEEKRKFRRRESQEVVYFINVKHTNFSPKPKRNKKKLPKHRSYEKLVRKTLMKLTP
jgi:hypothetical protein